MLSLLSLRRSIGIVPVNSNDLSSKKGYSETGN